MRDGIKFWMGMPALIIGVVLSTGTVLGWFGFKVATPEDTLQNHVGQEIMWHSNAESEHEIIRGQSQELHTDVHQQRQFMEALVIRSCLRDNYEELVLQRLLQICLELGINRVPGSGLREITDSIENVNAGS